MVNMHLILPIEQRELKGVSSFEKNLHVFKGEEYYTSLFFFFLNGRKDTRNYERWEEVSVKQTPITCEAVLSEWCWMWTIGLPLAVILCFMYLE